MSWSSIIQAINRKKQGKVSIEDAWNYIHQLGEKTTEVVKSERTEDESGQTQD